MGCGAEIRLYLRDGRRLQPQPERPSATVRRLCPRGIRRGHRVALRERGERGELAHGAHPDVLLRLQIRAHHHGAEDKRHHGRL